jgi:hypothetical protein
MKGIEPLTPSLPWKCSTPELHRLVLQPLSQYLGAGDETRTHDPQLGRLMLYQLSYARKFTFSMLPFCFSHLNSNRHFTPDCGGNRNRTYSV